MSYTKIRLPLPSSRRTPKKIRAPRTKAKHWITNIEVLNMVKLMVMFRGNQFCARSPTVKRGSPSKVTLTGIVYSEPLEVWLNWAKGPGSANAMQESLNDLEEERMINFRWGCDFGVCLYWNMGYHGVGLMTNFYIHPNQLGEFQKLTKWYECMCKWRTVCLEIGKEEDVEVGKYNKTGQA